MKIRELMSTDVITLQTCDRAADAWETLRARGARHAIVVEDGAVVGVISQGDLGHGQDAALRMGRVVGQLMSRDVVSTTPDGDVRAAAKLMRSRSLGCLPVLEHGRVAGMITVGDLLALVEKHDARLRMA